MGLFDERKAFKPFEYPSVVDFKNAIAHSSWLVSEWNFTKDIQDFKVKLMDSERNALKNALLAISQIEVEVKRFWSKLGDRFPKAEFDQVGITFGESEVRHADAYSHLLEILGLNDDFAALLKDPVIQGRVDYLGKYVRGSAKKTDQEYSLVLALFSIFVENVSLFSQFLVVKSFNKYLNVLKDVDNVIQATQKEEQVHALFGVHLIKLIKAEHPDWFGKEFTHAIRAQCRKAFKAEEKIVDWIFEKGDLSFLTKAEVIEFLRDRFNKSLVLLDEDPIFPVDHNLLKGLRWFEEEIHAEANTDFFHKRPVTYSLKSQSIEAEDLF